MKLDCQRLNTQQKPLLSSPAFPPHLHPPSSVCGSSHLPPALYLLPQSTAPRGSPPHTPSASLRARLMQPKLHNLAFKTPRSGPCASPALRYLHNHFRCSPTSLLPAVTLPQWVCPVVLFFLLISPQLLCLVETIPPFGSAQIILCLRDFFKQSSCHYSMFTPLLQHMPDTTVLCIRAVSFHPRCYFPQCKELDLHLIN